MIDKAISTRQTPLFVACGMYAFTDQLREAWQQLFEHFFNLVEPTFDVDRLLKFETGHSLLNHPSLWIGHTCGYPLMTRFRETLTPISVPVFDVAGCDRKYYSSRLIVPRDSEIRTLQDSKGLRAVINARDSNSGMNVLRHAAADFNEKGSFFSEIQISGSHLQSLTAVANQHADIAAIDCVSYRLIEDAWPDLAARVRSIGFTAKTCGLPFVMPKHCAGDFNFEKITGHLNHALSTLDPDLKKRLHLRGFENVNIAEYQGIVDLEVSAQEAGYPILT